MHARIAYQRTLALLTALLGLAAPAARGDIAENQVLVVYNSASSEGVALLASYLAAHPAIPLANVVDLNDPLLLTADVAQANFISRIRNPIRNHLLATGAPDPAGIIAIALLRPIPHRVLDTDAGSIGDSPNNASVELGAGDATYAAVDAELALLWQNLETGEAGGTMDSLSDNAIDNPYHTSNAPIDSFSRTSITTPKSFTNLGNGAWILAGSGAARLTPGDIYLVCRVDGATLADAEALIARAADNRVDRRTARILLDEYDTSVRGDLDDDPLFTTSDPFLAGDDYEETRDLLQPAGWSVRYDATFNFISSSEEAGPLVAYASYGENHDIGGAGEDPPGVGSYINGFNLAPGAVFNTIESYNGRALNGLGTAFGQEQIADFITVGGTFAVGNVYEPFTFSLPDNEFLLGNLLLHGRTFAEAAWSSFPALSWQQIAVGDPLGCIHLLGDVDGDGDLAPGDTVLLVDCLAGPGVALPPAGCSAADFDRADLDRDGDVDLADLGVYQSVYAD